jgi:hypothetical protein
MTTRQRRWHLVLWLVLGPAIAAGLVLGLSARQDQPKETFNPDVVEVIVEVSP